MNNALISHPAYRETLRKALFFDGSDDFVSTNGVIGASATSFVINLGIYRPAQGTNQMVMSQGNISHIFGFQWFTDNIIYIFFRNSNNGYSYKLDTDTGYFYFTIVYNSAEALPADRIKLYKNAVKQAITNNGPISGAISATPGSLFIGRYDVQFTTGAFYDIGLKPNATITDAQVLELYHTRRKDLYLNWQRYYSLNGNTIDAGTDAANGVLNNFPPNPYRKIR